MKLPKPNQEAIIYQDKKLYACLANFPIVKGHTVVVWRDKVEDLSKLGEKDYAYLADTVDHVRSALMKTLKVKKVYLMYMDEINQVHWHLIPRYNEKGATVLLHKPKVLKDFSLTEKIVKNLKIHGKNK